MSHAELASQPSPSARPRRPAWLHSPYKPMPHADRVEHNGMTHWLLAIEREIRAQMNSPSHLML
jgi:hypothetical protein